MQAWITFKNKETADLFRDLVKPFDWKLVDYMLERLTDEDYDNLESERAWIVDGYAASQMNTNFTNYHQEDKNGDGLTVEFHYIEGTETGVDDMIEVIRVWSYLCKDERILLESYDDYYDYYMHYIFENGFYEEYDGGWLKFDPYDYEDEWLDDVEDGDIPVGFTHLHIDINADDYNQSWALWDCFAPPLSYLLTPNNPPKKEELIIEED